MFSGALLSSASPHSGRTVNDTMTRAYGTAPHLSRTGWHTLVCPHLCGCCRQACSLRAPSWHSTTPGLLGRLVLPQLARRAGVTIHMATFATVGSLSLGKALAGARVLPVVSAPSETAFAQMDDAAIMLELRTGNMAGFDFLLKKYRRPIISFMYRMVHNQAVAEELAQEVFLRVYRSRETYRAEARFSTWLYRIATNLGVNYVRDHKSERTASTVYLDEPDAESGSTPDLPDGTASAEATMLRRERLNSIREHVMALPERQRMAVLMHKYEEMDYRQIGDVLKLSESATKSLLFRAYQTLRERLKDYV